MVKTCLFENGKRSDFTLDKATIPALDAAYLFGDGVYEVIAVINGRPFDLESHLARLENSLKTVLIEQPMPIAEIAAELQKLLDTNSNGYIYLQISRGAHTKRDFLIAKETKSSFFAYFQEQELFPKQSEGETSLIFPDIRWQLRHVKTTQLMASRLAKKCAVEAGAFEPLYISPDNIITEGGSSNLFIVKNKTIFTHPADNNILWGITRQRVMELAGNVVERKFTLDEMLAADEVFRTSTTQGVRGISKIKITELQKQIFAGVDKIWQPEKLGEHKIGDGKLGETTKSLAAKYIELATKSPLPQGGAGGGSGEAVNFSTATLHPTSRPSREEAL